jgi:hypothetical protein
LNSADWNFLDAEVAPATVAVLLIGETDHESVGQAVWAGWPFFTVDNHAHRIAKKLVWQCRFSLRVSIVLVFNIELSGLHRRAVAVILPCRAFFFGARGNRDSILFKAAGTDA